MFSYFENQKTPWVSVEKVSWWNRVIWRDICVTQISLGNFMLPWMEVWWPDTVLRHWSFPLDSSGSKLDIFAVRVPFPLHHASHFLFTQSSEQLCFTFFCYNHLTFLLLWHYIPLSHTVCSPSLLTHFIYTILSDSLGSPKNGLTIWSRAYYLLLLKKNITFHFWGISFYSYGLLYEDIDGLFYLSDYIKF